MQPNPEAQPAVTPAVLEAASGLVLPEADRKPLPVPQALDAWDQVLLRARRLLREEPIDAAWITRFTELGMAIRQLAARDPDLALYVLIEANGSNVNHYSAQHAVTCLVIADLAAQWMEWPEEERRALASAALSMNLSITVLQDSLAKQSTSLSDGQRTSVATHAASSASMLAAAVSPIHCGCTWSGTTTWPQRSTRYRKQTLARVSPNCCGGWISTPPN